eukprot:11212168-Alexandrium_andersonii.AAC.1
MRRDGDSAPSLLGSDDEGHAWGRSKRTRTDREGAPEGRVREEQSARRPGETKQGATQQRRPAN